MDRIILHSAIVAAAWLLAGCSLLTTPDERPAATAPAERRDHYYQVEEARTLIESGAKVIDVRTPEEFATGHLEGAVNLPHTLVRQRIAAIAPVKSTPLVLYCGSGRRAEIARQDLVDEGYSRVVNGGSIADLQ